LNYPHPGPVGQYNWQEDAYRAMRYYLDFEKLIKNEVYEYSPDTFKRFPYSGVSETQKRELYRAYKK